jgi:hypothetical protein
MRKLSDVTTVATLLMPACASVPTVGKRTLVNAVCLMLQQAAGNVP